ncbi:MAG: hypothetical protein IJ379_01625 [Lachnospiraceae bacterium]|nr:hypothetical protein [Lachnospiraceae bacterium]
MKEQKLKDWLSGKQVKVCIVLILTFLSLLAMAYVSQLRNVYRSFGRGIEPVFMAVFVAWLLFYYTKLQDKRKKIVSIFGGLLLSLTHVFGMYLHYKNDLFIGPGQVLLLFILVLGIGILTVPLFALMLSGLQKATQWWESNKAVPAETKRFLFLKYWVGIFVCWIPIFLCYWPVNFVYDAQFQLREVLSNDYKIHHPLLHTYLMGITYKLGGKLGSVSLGISFYTIIQMLILSAAFAYTLKFLYDRKVPKAARVGGFIFYAIFPINPLFSITATKDVMFAAFFLVYFIMLIRTCFLQEELTWKNLVPMVLIGILMVLFRKNAIYAMLAAIPFLLWIRKGLKNKAIILIACLLIAGLSEGVDAMTIKALHAHADSSLRESMSVPLQQVTRVVSYRGEELDKELYDELANYWIPEDMLGYNPYLSDPVKNTVNTELLGSNLMNFFKLWAKIGLQFPGEYIESILTNTLGYWYLGDTDYAFAEGDSIALYHTLIGMGEEIVKHNYCPIVGMVYDPLFLYLNYREVPILGILFRSSSYVWLLLVYLFWVIYRKEYPKMNLAMILFAYLGTCLLGPWVAIRYIYCLIVCVPLVITLAFYKKE